MNGSTCPFSCALVKVVTFKIVAESRCDTYRRLLSSSAVKARGLMASTKVFKSFSLDRYGVFCFKHSESRYLF